MISTKNIKTETTAPEGGFTKSLIAPGNHKLKINSIILRPESKAEFGVKLIMSMETAPISGAFKGFNIDAKDPSKGTYKGQIGNVSYSKWGMKDFLMQNDVQILRDEEILAAIKTICDTLGIEAWLDAADNRFATMEAFVEGFNADAPFKDIYAHYCIAGREYPSKDGKHINHELFLPREDRTLGKAFSLNEDKVQKFFYSNHVEPLKDKSTVVAKTATVQSTTDNGTEFKTLPEQTTKEQRDLDFLNSLNEAPEPTKPVNPPITSQAEANFMNEGKKMETPFTDEMNAETQNTDIVTGDPNEIMPWDPGYKG